MSKKSTAIVKERKVNEVKIFTQKKTYFERLTTLRST